MLTKEKMQEWFDRAVEGLAGQGFTRSVNAGGNCRYRGVDGKKCAVGFLIEDKDYVPEWDVSNSLEGPVYLLSGCRYSVTTAAVFKFLGDLQMCHDTAYTADADSPKKMKKNLRDFAIEHDLTIPAVLQ